MATYTWINGHQGLFSDAADWSGDLVPGSGDTAVISAAGDGAPTLPTSTPPPAILQPPSGGSAVYLCGALDRSTLVQGSDSLDYFTSLQPNQVTPGETLAGGTIDLIGAGSETAIYMQDSELAAPTVLNVSGAAFMYSGYTNILAGTINIGLPFSVGGQTVATPPVDPQGLTSELEIHIEPFGSWSGGSVATSYVPSTINDGTIRVGAGSGLVLNIEGDAAFTYGSNPEYYSASTHAAFDNEGSIAIGPGGLLVGIEQYNQGAFINNGLITITGAAGASTAAGFTTTYGGDGELLVSGGSQTDPTQTYVDFANAVTGGEVVIADATAVLDPTASVTGNYSGGSVVFGDAHASLQIYAPFTSSIGQEFSDTISGFRAGDSIDLSFYVGVESQWQPSLTWDQATNTLSLYNNDVNGYYQATTELEAAFTIEGTYSASQFQITDAAWGGDPVDPAPSTLSIVTTNPLTAPETYTLTKTPVVLEGGAGNDTFVATNGALVAADRIDGGGGTNTLELSGAGTFNLAAPAVLADIQIVTATEAAVGAHQTVTLRAGLNLTVDVAAAAANPKTAGIVIIGAANSDVINLAGGVDSVTLGGSGETVHGGGGADQFFVDAATIGATIGGGTGTSTLDVTGGGTLAMGADITRIAAVVLDGPAKGTIQPAYNFRANGLAGLAITGSGGADRITLLEASQSVNANGGAVHVVVNAANAGAKVTGAAGAVLEIVGGGTATLNAATTNVTVTLDAATHLTLNKMAFITAVGSAGNDVIVAGGAGQTLTGGLGTDTLVGASVFGDTFRDTTAGLNHDTIENFGGSDVIDVTDMAYVAALKPAYKGNAQSGVLTLTDGKHTAAITLLGSYSATEFTPKSDGHGGLLVSFKAG
jgi:hypothetical protein